MKQINRDARIAKNARKMRRKPTFHESLMYNALLAVFKPYRAFVRPQEIIGRYIADFCIFPSNLVIEIDGASHGNQEQRVYDETRTAYLIERGFVVYRYDNAKVKEDAARIAESILALCLPLPSTADEVIPTRCPPGSALHGKKAIKRAEFYRVR